MRQDNAAEKIQHSYKAFKSNRRAGVLLKAVLRIQRTWLGAIQRKWNRNCNASATYIQKIVRGTQVRLCLDKDGRDIARRFQGEMNLLLKAKKTMSETEYVAKTGALAGKLRVALARQRDLNIDLRRMPTFTAESAHTHTLDKRKRMAMKGSVQPARLSEFEPMVFALAKMEPRIMPRYGASKSPVLNKVYAAKRQIEKSLPREQTRRPHAAAKRGRKAVIARRLAKKPKLKAMEQAPTLNEDLFRSWASAYFKPRRF